MRCGICGFPDSTVCGCERRVQANPAFAEWRRKFDKQEQVRQLEREWQVLRQSLMPPPLPSQPLPAPLSAFWNDAYAEPAPALPTADTMGPIRAWRLWAIKGERLWSVSHAAEWKPGVPMRGAPTQHGEAGVYAVKARDHKFQYRGDTILGEVGLWGRVIEHEHGYRAEFAYPIRLVLRMPKMMPGFPSPPGETARLQAIATTYGIPLTVEETP